MDGNAESDRKRVALGALLYGARAGIVASFCYFTASRVSFLHEVYWAPIAAVVVLYPDRQATQRAGIDRFFGTAIGSLLGWGTAVVWNQNIALYGIAVLLAVGLCYVLRLENAARLCAVTVTVITLIPRPEPIHVVAFYRFVEVSYGVACALGFTLLTDWVVRRHGARRELR
jgi:uncharacterized membrane protein YgaE (UPF0421/DUF939 family)